MLIALIVLATIGAIAGGVYMFGQADDLIKFVMEKYFKAEATAEEKALEKAGATKAEGFLSVDGRLQPKFEGYAADPQYRKDRLKQNPVVSNAELNQVSGGLGDEAAREYGKRGLGKGIGQAFD